MIEVISKKTRNYAKRQLTWMRNKMNCVFVEMKYGCNYDTKKIDGELLKLKKIYIQAF